MKISVVCKKNEWQTDRLKEEAQKLSLELEVIDINSVDDLPDTLGEVVFWRSSSLGSSEKRTAVMNTILKKHILINRCLALLPQATEKAFQQEYLQKKTSSIRGVPTFRFQSKKELENAIHEKILSYPFIAKPNKGSKGEGVVLVRSVDDLALLPTLTTPLVFQNYIKNTGDYRIFVLGGRVLGVIKRIASKGGFLNNISQGGTAEMVTDQHILNALQYIGTTVASIFELTICGVDVIYDEESREFFFLEVNTVPQWKGFQLATGINVASEIVLFCRRLEERKNQTTVQLVRNEYDSQIHLLRNKKFHYLSRLFLWTGENGYKESLNILQDNYIGTSFSDHEKILLDLYATPKEHGQRMASKEERTLYFQKYPQLEPFLNLLFKYLFSQKIYGIDLRFIIEKIVSREQLLSLKSVLENDEEALRILSTHALNYLYLLEFYLGADTAKTNPEHYLRIGSTYVKKSYELQLYFFTHCIIGASRFYSEEIPRNDLPLYQSMLTHAEQIISKNFQDISLDNKFEFLVCAKLCNFPTTLEKKILAEANHSLSPNGNFLIDTQNQKALPDERNDFLGAEHRNALFIMSQTPFHTTTL